MRLSLLIILLLAVDGIPLPGIAADSPQTTVRGLYQQIVARKPIGIPKKADKVAIRPFLSEGLIRRLEAAQACETDYIHTHAGSDAKPAYPWLETGLFSGANEKGIAAEAVVEHAVKQKNGSVLVYVRLTYKESFETYGKPPDPANRFNWRVAAVVTFEGGRSVVDDILFFKDDSAKIDSRLTDSFAGCDGPRWVGGNM